MEGDDKHINQTLNLWNALDPANALLFSYHALKGNPEQCQVFCAKLQELVDDDKLPDIRVLRDALDLRGC